MASIDHHADEHHGLSHVATIKVLCATGGTLLFLTLVTVLATRQSFPLMRNPPHAHPPPMQRSTTLKGQRARHEGCARRVRG